MKPGPAGSFGGQLKTLREAAGFTQEELATIAGLSVHAVSALERGQRRRPHVETVRALSAALDLTGATRDALLGSARAPAHNEADELSGVSLPLALTPLLGRVAEVQTLRGWLTDPAARLITLTGPGGVGKTRLALEIARAIATEGATRVVFVPLAAIQNPAFVASAICEALGLSDVSALDLPGRARVVCGDQQTLLVLDNFEQVLDASPLVTDLLISVAALRVLATSRAPLHVRGEREYPVGPLALEVDVDAMSPADLARCPAVRLFVERVRDVEPGFRLTSANGPIVTAICRRLDALPLALELAAPWIKVLPVEELLRRLTHDVLLSTAGPRDLPERQQTINATVAWSYQLLGPNEQRAFRRFGALPGRFPIQAAAAVLAGREGPPVTSDDALRAVAALIDRSLLLRAETSVATRPLYQMLETVRAYAALELTASGDRDDGLDGLAHYCTAEASLAAEGLVGRAQAEWLDRVRDDLENYRSALGWLIERGRPAEASGIAWGLKYFWLIRGHAAEGLQWYEEILNLPSLPPAAGLRALVGAAVLWYTQGELDRARSGLNRALALAHGATDMDVVAHAEYLLGHVEHAAGNANAARDRFARSVEQFRSLAIPSGTGNALSGMAAVALSTGDAVLAERLLDEATSVLRQVGPWFLTWALYVRAILEVRRGNADGAVALLRESLTRIHELNDKFAFVYSLVPLAAAAVLKGDDAWAARILGTRDAVTERTGVTVVDRSVQDLREQAEREARARLGPDRWGRAYAAGRVTSIDSLIKDIDSALRSRTLDTGIVLRNEHLREKYLEVDKGSVFDVSPSDVRVCPSARPGVLMSQIAALRPIRALSPAIAISVMLMSGVFVSPVLAQDAAVLEIDRTMENYRLDAHLPGIVWGIVQDGKLVHVKGAGIQDVDTRRAVTADTLFRIASMTKAFTALSILKLRDEGKLALDAPVEAYVPELRGWNYPTEDSPKIRVRELLTHTAGLVTDDPWGDRQTPLPESDFTRLLSEGVPFTRPPATAMEYSNLGYALLGRIIANVSGKPYKDFVQGMLLAPLGMASTGYDVAAAPSERRALGYRWEDDAWKLEPTMMHGAFGAMGGIQTSATDYAKWVSYLLSAWPPRDGTDGGPVRRSSVRELAQGANFPSVRQRPGSSGAGACRQASTYAMGFYAATDCELGLTLSHGGGYPGYGSFVLLLPDSGVGIFALANRTYAGPRPPVWDAAVTLLRAGRLKTRSQMPSPALTTGYAAAAKMFTTASVTSAGDVLAMNFLMDRDAEHWARDFAELKAQVGNCDTAAPIAPTGALAATSPGRASAVE